MTHFITTNAVALVATLGSLLVACVCALYVTILRRARQRKAVQRLLGLVETEGRYACDAAVSRFVHDINNMILVLSMESERLEESQQTEVLQQVIAEGRDIVERCRSQMTAVETASSDLCAELRTAARLLGDAEFGDVDVAVARAVPPGVKVSRPATDVHLLVLSIARAAKAGGGPDRLSLTVSKGRDASLPEDDNDSGWVNVSIVGPERLAGDDAECVALSRISRRLSGEVVFPDAGSGRRRLAVSLPVTER